MRLLDRNYNLLQQVALLQFLIKMASVNAVRIN